LESAAISAIDETLGNRLRERPNRMFGHANTSAKSVQGLAGDVWKESAKRA
jgi:hypothetical protein